MARFISSAVVGLGLLLEAIAPALAEFPDGKPITIVIPFAQGGAQEAGFRALAPALEKALGAKVIILNRPGWGGQVGLAEFVKASPDGHTLVYLPLPNVIELYLDPNRNPGFERKDFLPLAQLWEVPIVLSVATNNPIKDFEQFVQMAKAKPGAMMVADAGLLTPQHMFTGLLTLLSGLTLDPIHFTEGASGANRVALAGAVDAAANSRPDLLPLLASGKMRALAISAENPDPLLPGVPTVKSFGIPVAYAIVTALAAPAGTPPEVAARLEQAVKAALSDGDTTRRLREAGYTPAFKDGKELAALWADYDRVIVPLVKAEIKPPKE